ncbi:MAG: C-type lectin domain-containing protein, partial [Phycisphaerales bacterium]|nr:C-type lectin domain-containing protein [Phycisphaerales bacterium]
MLKIYTAAVAILAVSGFANAQDAVQWTEAEGGNGHWYQCIVSTITWDDAQQEASQVGGYLATPTTQAEHEFLTSYVST